MSEDPRTKEGDTLRFKLEAGSRPRSLVIPCLLGLESVVGDELRELGVASEDIRQENGQVYWDLDPSGSADVWAERLNRALYLGNVGLATAERLQVELARDVCETFDAVFDFARSLPWEAYIPENYFIHISGWSRKSKIFGISAAQSLVKRAIVDRLLEVRRLNPDSIIEEDSDVGEVRIQMVFQDDILSLRLDTSGDGLHKRGYRLEQGEAPLKETLAAALIRLSMWPRRKGEGLYDPFCGSGTFIIEAARAMEGIAPGSLRRFRFEDWPENNPTLRDAYLTIPKPELNAGPILGSDIDPRNLRLAERNAERAGVSDLVRFFRADILQDSFLAIPEFDEERPMLILTNPPYGERMDSEVKPLHQALKRELFDGRGLLPRRRLTVITAAPEFEADMTFVADKRRKLYNGMILSPMYHYHRAGRTKAYGGRSR